jgi:hypothetical protein
MRTPILKRLAVTVVLIAAIITISAVRSGSIRAAAFSAQGHNCGAMGSYGYTGFGTIFEGNALGLPPGTASTNGTITFSRNGQVTVVEAEMVDGVLISPSSTFGGTFTVNPDCTFTATLPPLPGTAFVGVFVDNGNQIRAMDTIPGVQTNYVSTVRVHTVENSQ